MKSAFQMSLAGCLVLLLLSCGQPDQAYEYEYDWPNHINRQWIGPQFWANQLQDWRLREGHIEYIGGKKPLRTLYLLTHELTGAEGELSMTTTVTIPEDSASETGFAGFIFGAGNASQDFRRNAMIFGASGKNGGYIAALKRDGRLQFLDNENGLAVLSEQPAVQPITLPQKLKLTVHLSTNNTGSKASFILQSTKGDTLNSCTFGEIAPERLSGLVGFVAHNMNCTERTPLQFEYVHLSGSNNLTFSSNRSFGPIWGVQYTQSRGILKLTAQLPPLHEKEPASGMFQVRESGTENWQQLAKTPAQLPSWTLPFRVFDWDTAKTWEFRIGYPLQSGDSLQTYWYHGLISAEPQNDSLVVAAFGRNRLARSIDSVLVKKLNYDFDRSNIWFPRRGLLHNILSHQPDMLVFTGNQIDHLGLVPADKSGKPSSYTDYLHRWALFLWEFGEITRRMPAITMPGSHDYFQTKLWGESGKKARSEKSRDAILVGYQQHPQYYQQDGGGFVMPGEWVNMVQQTQTSHLQTPWDGSYVEQEIDVWFTDMLYNNVNFALLEDQKFRSAPQMSYPKAGLVNGIPKNLNFDVTQTLEKKEALLGQRQAYFLQSWSEDWLDSNLKVVVSGRPFTSFYAVKERTNKAQTAEFVPEIDYGNNVWPQSKREQALHTIRKGFALHLSGGEVGGVVQYGLNDWDDAGFGFILPPLGTEQIYEWQTRTEGDHKPARAPTFMGHHLDAFGNKLHVWAVANPIPIENGVIPNVGYGILRFKKSEQHITMECWPLGVNPTHEDAWQFPGWPISIHATDNYLRKPVAWLPEMVCVGLNKPPILQVVSEATDEVVYTLRLKEFTFRPMVYEPGTYTIKIGEPDLDKVIVEKGIEAKKYVEDRFELDFR